MRTRKSGEFTIPTENMASEQARGLRRKRRSSVASVDSSFDAHVNVAGQSSSAKNAPVRKRAKRTAVTSSQQLQHELDDASNYSDALQSSVETDDEHIIETRGRSKQVRIQVDMAPETITPPDTISPTKSTIMPTDPLTPSMCRMSTSPHPHAGSHRRQRSGSSFIREGTDGSMVEVHQFIPYREQLDNRTRRTLRRRHLSEAMNDIADHERQDRRTRRELEELKKQIEEKNSRMQELESEMKHQRQNASQTSDADHLKMQEMEVELTKLRDEVAEHQRISDANDGLSVADTDVDMEYTFLSTDDFDGEILSTKQHEPKSPHMASVPYPTLPAINVVQDPTHEREVKLFEQVLTNKNHDIADLQSKLQIYSTELKTLGFGSPEDDPLIILAKARGIFRRVRADLESTLPEIQTSTHHNGELVIAMAAEIKELIEALKEQTASLQQTKESEASLKGKLMERMEKLSATENRRRELEGMFTRIDRLSDERGKVIVDLEDKLADLQEVVEELERLRVENDATIEELSEENATKEVDKSKLQVALTKALKDLDHESKMLQKLDKDYTDHITKIEKGHAQEIQDLEGEINKQTRARSAAQIESKEKSELIDDLEAKLDDINETVLSLKAELQDAQDEAAEQKARGDALNEELDQRIADITDLQLKLEDAEESRDVLSTEVSRLKKLVEMEHRQREKAESDLDDRNNDVEILNDRLRETNLQVNELKSKLFEAQERRKQELADLSEQAAQREDDLQSQLDNERDANTTAEARIDELNGVITDMEDKLRNLEDDLITMSSEKDRLLSERAGRIKELEALLKEHDNRHEKFAEKKGREIQSLHNDIGKLNKDLAARAKKIEAMEAEAEEERKSSQEIIDNQSEMVTNLEANLAAARNDIAVLEKQKAHLERRVEETATELLNTQNEYADDIDGLNKAIRERDVAIGRLSLENQDLQTEHKNSMLAKNTLIHSLECTARERAEDVEYLSVRVEDLEHENEETRRQAKEAMDKMNQTLAATLSANQREQEKFEEDKHMVDSGLGTPASQDVSGSIGAIEAAHTTQRRSIRVKEKTKTVRRRESRKESENDDSAFFEDEEAVEAVEAVREAVVA